MSLTLSIGVVSDTASPLLATLGGTLERPRALHAALGGRVKAEVQAHFLRRESEPNARGWPKSGFFGTRSQRIAVEAQDNGATVRIADPDRALARKITGGSGPIYPREAKAISLPQTAEAAGKSPRFFNDLRFIPFRNKGNLVGALVQRAQTPVRFGRKRKDGSRRVTAGPSIGGKVFYFLVKSVNPKRDPRAMPSTRLLGLAVREQAGLFLSTEIARAAAAGRSLTFTPQTT